MSNPLKLVTPHSDEAERCVIGCALLDPERVLNAIISDGVTAEYFYNPITRTCFENITAMHAAGAVVDVLTFSEHLRKCGMLDGIGGNQFIESLVDEVVTTSHIAHYLSILRSLHIRRCLIRQSRSMIEKSAEMGRDDDVLDVISEAQFYLAKLSESANGAVKKPPLHEVGRIRIREWMEPGEVKGVHWPTPRMDKYFGPMGAKELVLIAAQTSVGKTALAVQLSIVNAMVGIQGSYNSLESPAEGIVQRFMANIGGVNTFNLRMKRAIPEHYQRGLEAMDRLEKLPIRFSDTPMNEGQLLAWARTEVAAGSKYLIVDNLRHVRTAKDIDDPVRQLYYLSLMVKHIRDSVGVPLIALHHLNEEMKTAWSRDVDKDVDIMIKLGENETLSRAPTPADPAGLSIIDVMAAKCRDAARGWKLQLNFDKARQRFDDYSVG